VVQSERRWRSLATCHQRVKKRREEEARREVKVLCIYIYIGSIYILTYKRILEHFERWWKMVSEVIGVVSEYKRCLILSEIGGYGT